MAPARTALLNGIARLCFLLILGIFTQPAHALPEDCTQDGGQATCTAPITTPGPWQHHLCDDAGAYFIRYAMWCTAMGGTWMGSNAPVWCVGADPTLDESELYPYAETFERLIHNVQSCSLNGQDNGWLSPGQILNSWNCWSGGPVYQNGIEVSNLREMLFSGQSYDTNTQSCGTGTWTERVMALRTRQIQTGCPANYTLRSSRFTGQLECFTMAVQCPIDPIPEYTPDPYPALIEELSPRMQTALSCLRAAIGGQGGSSSLKSGYRPAPYNAHIQAVFDQRAKLRDRGPECAARKAELAIEEKRHDIGEERPGNKSLHIIREAFDLQSSLSRDVTNGLAIVCNAFAPLPLRDRNHFEHTR